MSLEAIREEVLSSARKEAEAIIEKAQAESEAKLAEARRIEEERFQNAVAREKSRLEGKISAELTNLRQEVKLEILAAKNSVIDKVFSIALEMLENLPLNEKKDLLLKSLKSLPSDVSGEVLMPPNDAARFGKALVEEANRFRGDAGKFTGPSSDPNIRSGLRVRGSGYEIDLTFATRVSELKGEVISTIAERLFGKK